MAPRGISGGRRRSNLTARIGVLAALGGPISASTRQQDGSHRRSAMVSKAINRTAPSLRDDDARWEAVRRRDRNADGAFYYAVRTTGIYCRPSCGSRLPLRKNVAFYADPAAAERAGFRPCKRCKPTAQGTAHGSAERQAAAVAKACRLIETA